jgi:hypothetical protein
MAANPELTGRTPVFFRLWHRFRDAVTYSYGVLRNIVIAIS